jgi:hypothetical protein
LGVERMTRANYLSDTLKFEICVKDGQCAHTSPDRLGGKEGNI